MKCHKFEWIYFFYYIIEYLFEFLGSDYHFNISRYDSGFALLFCNILFVMRNYSLDRIS